MLWALRTVRLRQLGFWKLNHLISIMKIKFAWIIKRERGKRIKVIWLNVTIKTRVNWSKLISKQGVCKMTISLKHSETSLVKLLNSLNHWHQFFNGVKIVRLSQLSWKVNMCSVKKQLWRVKIEELYPYINLNSSMQATDWIHRLMTASEHYAAWTKAIIQVKIWQKKSKVRINFWLVQINGCNCKRNLWINYLDRIVSCKRMMLPSLLSRNKDRRIYQNVNPKIKL